MRVRIAGPSGIIRPIARALAESPIVAVCQSPDAAVDALVFAPRPQTASAIEPDLRESAQVLEMAARSGVRTAVVLASGAIYGASPHNIGMMPEAIEPFPAEPSSITSQWRALEALARSHFPPQSLTILRTPPVLVPEDWFAQLLTRSVAATLPGHDPVIQLLDADDFGRAVRRVLERAAAGVYHVAPSKVIPLREALHIAGCHRVAVPRTVQSAWRKAATPLGLSQSPDYLRFLQYPWTLSAASIACAVGFTPRYSSRQALLRYLGVPEREPDVEFDDFGFDAKYIAAHSRTWLSLLERYYWRIEVRGLEHVPLEGRAVLTGVHRGFMPLDGVMTLHLLARRIGRYPRFLIHPALVKFPFLSNFMTKLGGVLACRRNAESLLDRDEIVGVYPEGIRGAFTPYKQAYILGKFGRDEFVRLALRHRAPIVPFVTVGSAEIFPILANVRWSAWERWTLWPSFPITPTFPLLPIPLPSKWHIRFLPAIHVECSHPPEAAGDPRVVATIGREVKAQMQAAIDDILRRRRFVFFGSVFGGAAESEGAARSG